MNKGPCTGLVKSFIHSIFYPFVYEWSLFLSSRYIVRYLIYVIIIHEPTISNKSWDLDNNLHWIISLLPTYLHLPPTHSFISYLLCSSFSCLLFNVILYFYYILILVFKSLLFFFKFIKRVSYSLFWNLLFFINIVLLKSISFHAAVVHLFWLLENIILSDLSQFLIHFSTNRNLDNFKFLLLWSIVLKTYVHEFSDKLS